jgi:hypothetical protein
MEQGGLRQHPSQRLEKAGALLMNCLLGISPTGKYPEDNSSLLQLGKSLKSRVQYSLCKVFKMINVTCYNIAELKSRGAAVSSPCCHCMTQWSLLSQNKERLIGSVMTYHTNQDYGLHSSLLRFKRNKDFCYELECNWQRLYDTIRIRGDNCSMLCRQM